VNNATKSANQGRERTCSYQFTNGKKRGTPLNLLSNKNVQGGGQIIPRKRGEIFIKEKIGAMKIAPRSQEVYDQ